MCESLAEGFTAVIGGVLIVLIIALVLLFWNLLGD